MSSAGGGWKLGDRGDVLQSIFLDDHVPQVIVSVCVLRDASCTPSGIPPHFYLPSNLPKSFLSIRLRTLGSGIFAIPFFFNRLRTLQAKIPGGRGRAASVALAPNQFSGRSDPGRSGIPTDAANRTDPPITGRWPLLTPAPS